MLDVVPRHSFPDVPSLAAERAGLRRRSEGVPRTSSACHGPRVLIADSDEETRSLFRQAFETVGHMVVEAGDGRDALVKALEGRPRLVVAEARLPLIDGYALCEILRHDRSTSTIPILLVSAEEDARRLERARHAGADAVLTKPFHVDAIVNEASRLLEDGPQPRDDEPAPGAPRSGRLTQNKAHVRFNTRTPAQPPPDLRCRLCDGELTYQFSHIGGVNEHHPEQWDYFVCPRSCATYEYRQRTRKLREVDERMVRGMK